MLFYKVYTWNTWSWCKTKWKIDWFILYNNRTNM